MTKKQKHCHQLLQLYIPVVSLLRPLPVVLLVRVGALLLAVVVL